jgi:hypothetical protein
MGGKVISFALVLSICALGIAVAHVPDCSAGTSARDVRYPQPQNNTGLAVMHLLSKRPGSEITDNGTVFSDDFEDGDISDWSVTEEGSGDVAVEMYPGPDWSLNIDSPSGTSSRAQALSPTFDMVDSLPYDVSLEFAFEKPIHWVEVFRNKHINTVVDDCPGDHCTFRCRYGGSNYIIDNLYPNTFYRVRYEVRPESTEYDVYVGGVFKRTCGFDASSIPFPQFRIGDFEAGSANFGTAMYDDFVIAQVPAGMEDPECLPLRSGLEPNRPNPFRGATAIVYVVPKAGMVTLKVYDVRGVLVRTLVGGVHRADTYSVVWTAEDEMGNRVKPGIYFLRLEEGGLTDTRKMILVQ